MDSNALVKAALEYGADKAELIEPSKLVSSAHFRKYCEDNVCGCYGNCWACPPDIGEIDVLRAELEQYEHILLFQLVSRIWDYSDKDGLEAAGKRLSDTSRKLRAFLRRNLQKPFLQLGGMCFLCPECAKRKNEPCRYPEDMIPSLSAYGVDVCKTCEGTSLNYWNGENTIANFGMVLFNE